MKRSLPLLSASILALLAVDAQAQTVVDPSSSQAGRQDGVESPDGDDIVVTATRSETLLSKTPIALTATTGEQLIAQGISNPTQLSESVPNLSISRNGGGLQVTIRGITSADSTEKGDPSAAFMLDGVYIARPQAQEVSFFDIERVEVLRGPQGTLYGRNTTAGVVNVLSVEPKLTFGASADISYESYNHILATGVVNIPLGSVAAVRGAINYDRRDSYLNYLPNDGLTADPAKDNLSGRLSLLVEPTSDFKVVVRGTYSDMGGITDPWVPTGNFFAYPGGPTGYPPNGVPAPETTPLYVHKSKDRQRDQPEPDYWLDTRNNTYWGVSGEASWNLGDFTLTYLGGYSKLIRHERYSEIRGNLPSQFDGTYWQNSQEARLSYDKGILQLQTGLYYFKERSSIEFFLHRPQSIGFGPTALRFGFPQDPTIATSKAAFGQATIEPVPGLRFTGGVRYSQDVKSRVGQTVLDDINGTRAVFQDNNAKRTFSKTTWRAGVDYDAPGLGLIYASVSTGYKAGGFNDGCEKTATSPATCQSTAQALYYDPETLTAYEGGFKFRFGPAFRLNASAFHYDYKGLQLTSLINVCGGPCTVTSNAGAAKVDGVEVESILRPAENHEVNLSFNYLNARYTRFTPVPGVSYAGRPLSRSPKFTWSAGYSYTKPLDNGGRIVANVRTRFSSRYDLTDLGTRIHYYQPAFTRTGVSVTYEAPDNRFYVGVYANNLEDNNVLTKLTGPLAAFDLSGPTPTPSFFDGEATREDPRTIGVRAGVKF